MKKRRLRLGFASLLCALNLTAAGTVTLAHGATIVVNSTADAADPGNCTLREAIIAANTNTPVGACTAGSPYPAVDTISVAFSRFVCLSSGCTIVLQSPLPTITEDVIITGGTGLFSGLVTINGANAFRVFDVQGNDVTIAHLALVNGNAVGLATSGYGGAILGSALGGTLRLNNMTFSGNHAQTRGGVLYESGGIVAVDNCSFDSNTVDSFGGAIDQTNGVLIISNSTLSNNFAADGGGLEIQGVSDTRLTNVTFSGNQARGSGGAISRIGITNLVTLNNVTITNNTSDSDNSGFGDGGGIYRGGGNIVVSNSIIAGNFDTANNAGPGTINPDCSWQNGGGFTSNGYNVIGRGEGASGFTNGINGDKVGTAANPLVPKLGPLAFNGGSTRTHLLQYGSPALDGGNPATPGGGSFGACASTDQRGVVRPVDGNGDTSAICDSGAVEAPLTPSHWLGNVSTRGFVQTGANVMIGGFIVEGSNPKQAIVRALGPTLGQAPFNVPGVLVDPMLELHAADGSLITANDNWGSASNAAAISTSGFAPPNNKESAILTSLSPGNYTAIVRGAANATGVALVECYDLDSDGVASRLSNISTRGFVQTGNNVVIVGFIVKGPGSEDVIIRGLGPTLGQPPFNVPNSLANPFLDLRDANGNPIMTNDNWGDSQMALIQASGYAPPNASEAAILTTLVPGNYTAILRGVNNTTGNALVEVYGLN
jgi:CSLREA domain-containing protein